MHRHCPKPGDIIVSKDPSFTELSSGKKKKDDKCIIYIVIISDRRKVKQG